MEWLLIKGKCCFCVSVMARMNENSQKLVETISVHSMR